MIRTKEIQQKRTKRPCQWTWQVWISTKGIFASLTKSSLLTKKFRSILYETWSFDQSGVVSLTFVIRPRPWRTTMKRQEYLRKRSWRYSPTRGLQFEYILVILGGWVCCQSGQPYYNCNFCRYLLGCGPYLVSLSQLLNLSHKILLCHLVILMSGSI